MACEKVFTKSPNPAPGILIMNEHSQPVHFFTFYIKNKWVHIVWSGFLLPAVFHYVATLPCGVSEKYVTKAYVLFATIVVKGSSFYHGNTQTAYTILLSCPVTSTLPACANTALLFQDLSLSGTPPSGGFAHPMATPTSRRRLKNVWCHFFFEDAINHS